MNSEDYRYWVDVAKRWLSRGEVDFDADDVISICEALVQADELASWPESM